MKRAKNEELLKENGIELATPDVVEYKTYHAPRPKRYVYRIVPEEPHQHVTSHTGQKLYIRMKSDEKLSNNVGN